MIIRPLPPILEDGKIEMRALLETAAGDVRTLWYKFPETLRDRCTESADPFMTAAIFHIMRMGEPVVVEGTVSPSLLRNLDRYMAAWHHWKPDQHKRVEIRATIERESPAPKTDEVIMGFSGGIDSSFTAWKHANKMAGRQQVPLSAGVFVLGFDIPLRLEQADYKRAFERARIMTDSIGIELISVSTNFRELDDWWEHAFPSGLTSILKIFQGYYGGGMLASDSYQYHFNSKDISFGSNPFVDGWLGSGSFPIHHDGAEASRIEKIEALHSWPEAMQHIRLCWQGEQMDRNCCRCQKCIGSMLYFRVAGLPTPDCFPIPLEDEDIRSISYFDEPSRASSKRIIKMARDRGVHDSWVDALEDSLKLPPQEMNTPPKLKSVMDHIRGWFN
jgi:hypothetical protein